MSWAEENWIDYLSIFDEDYEDYFKFEKWYWNGKKIKDMRLWYLMNAICYLVRNPLDTMYLEEWKEKINEMLDEMILRIEVNDNPMTDWDFHKD